jgi:hypothetical protein
MKLPHFDELPKRAVDFERVGPVGEDVRHRARSQLPLGLSGFRSIHDGQRHQALERSRVLPRAEVQAAVRSLQRLQPVENLARNCKSVEIRPQSHVVAPAAIDTGDEIDAMPVVRDSILRHGTA